MKKLILIFLGIVCVNALASAKQPVTLEYLNAAYDSAATINAYVLDGKIVDKVWVSTFSFSQKDSDLNWDCKDASTALQWSAGNYCGKASGSTSAGMSSAFMIHINVIRSPVHDPVYGDHDTIVQEYAGNICPVISNPTASNITQCRRGGFTNTDTLGSVFVNSNIVGAQCKYVDESDRLICKMNIDNWDTEIQVFQHL